MQGGPQLPAQLIAINKDNVDRPAPQAACGATMGPGCGVPNGGSRMQGPECRLGSIETSNIHSTETRQSYRPACIETHMPRCPPSYFPLLSAGFLCLWMGEFLVSSSPLPRKAPCPVVAEGLMSQQGNLVEAFLGVHLARSSWSTPI